MKSSKAESSNIPYLCGGTFFTLLLEVKSASRPQRKALIGTADTVSQKSILAQLIRLIKSDFEPPSNARSFDSVQSAYKSCRSIKSVYLPFDDEKLIASFDQKVQENFPEALSLMTQYVKNCFDTASDSMNWLGRALMSLLSDDKLISDDECLFYKDGGMRKIELLSLKYVCVPALMLALWHFIVTRRKDNSLGRATFEAWCEKPEPLSDEDTQKQQWKFQSNIGQNRFLNVKFGMDSEELKNNEDEDGNAEAKVMKNTESADDDFSDKFKQETKDAEREVKIYENVHMINNGPGPQIKENNGNITITVNMPGAK